MQEKWLKKKEHIQVGSVHDKRKLREKLYKNAFQLNKRCN